MDEGAYGVYLLLVSFGAEGVLVTEPYCLSCRTWRKYLQGTGPCVILEMLTNKMCCLSNKLRMLTASASVDWEGSHKNVAVLGLAWSLAGVRGSLDTSYYSYPKERGWSPPSWHVSPGTGHRF